MTGPAHRPELNPQHEDAQSASEAQGPVMNCVPAERVWWVRERRRRRAWGILRVVYIVSGDGRRSTDLND
jgi:hypothetical protein